MESIATTFNLNQIILGLILSLIISIVSFKLRLFTKSGSIGSFIIGAIVFGLGGILFAIPMIVFFISSAIFSAIKTPTKKLSKIYFEKTGARDIYQVLANGGVGTVSVLIYFFTGNQIWFFIYLASLCEAAADTWATEIGTLSKSLPISITTLKRVHPGQSGGITLLGIIASALASLTIMSSSLIILESLDFSAKTVITFLLISANAGFVGSIFDSILGGSLQAKFKCIKCGNIIEAKNHCGFPADHIWGFRFLNNDMVNFFSILFSAISTGVVILLFY